jgi:hypothetical protein
MRAERGLSRNARNALFFAHRAFVPKAHQVAIRVCEFRAIAPEILLRPVGEGRTARRPFGKSRIDIIDLKPEMYPSRERARSLTGMLRWSNFITTRSAL